MKAKLFKSPRKTDAPYESDNLPTETWKHILSLLDRPSLVKARLVCKRWKAILEEHQIVRINKPREMPKHKRFKAKNYTYEFACHFPLKSICLLTMLCFSVIAGAIVSAFFATASKHRRFMEAKCLLLEYGREVISCDENEAGPCYKYWWYVQYQTTQNATVYAAISTEVEKDIDPGERATCYYNPNDTKEVVWDVVSYKPYLIAVIVVWTAFGLLLVLTALAMTLKCRRKISSLPSL